MRSMLMKCTDLAPRRSGKKDAAFRLNPVFQMQLQRALSGAIGPPKDHLPPALDSQKPTPADLNEYALKQWEALLLYLANAGLPGGERRGDQEPSKMVQGLLRRAGLVGNSEEGIRMSDAGFQFLLMDVYKQLWQVVREYVAEIEVSGVCIVFVCGSESVPSILAFAPAFTPPEDQVAGRLTIERYSKRMFYGAVQMSTITRLPSDGLSLDVSVADKSAVLHDTHTLLALDTLFNMVT
jgi:hypothetical protein